jgi:2-oxoglutarate ferredoxin oxidoreductase subunit alpha
MFRAFEVAENYQLPVLVLSDAYVAQRRQIRDAVNDRRERPRRWRWSPEDGPARFRLTDDHSTNAFRVPGTPGGTYLAAGIEHTEQGHPTADAGIHQLTAIGIDTKDWFRTFGKDGAKRGIVAWGSTYGMLREWVASNPGYRVFLPEMLHPFPLESFEAWRKGLDDVSVVELSFQGQFHRFLASLTDISGIRSLARSGGLPMSSRELTALLAATAAGTKERA